MTTDHIPGCPPGLTIAAEWVTEYRLARGATPTGGTLRKAIEDLSTVESKARLHRPLITELVAMLKRESVGYQKRCDCKWCKEVLNLINRAELAATA